MAESHLIFAEEACLFQMCGSEFLIQIEINKCY